MTGIPAFTRLRRPEQAYTLGYAAFKRTGERAAPVSGNSDKVDIGTPPRPDLARPVPAELICV